MADEVASTTVPSRRSILPPLVHPSVRPFPDPDATAPAPAPVRAEAPVDRASAPKQTIPDPAGSTGAARELEAAAAAAAAAADSASEASAIAAAARSRRLSATGREDSEGRGGSGSRRRSSVGRESGRVSEGPAMRRLSQAAGRRVSGTGSNGLLALDTSAVEGSQTSGGPLASPATVLRRGMKSRRSITGASAAGLPVLMSRADLMLATATTQPDLGARVPTIHSFVGEPGLGPVGGAGVSSGPARRYSGLGAARGAWLASVRGFPGINDITEADESVRPVDGDRPRGSEGSEGSPSARARGGLDAGLTIPAAGASAANVMSPTLVDPAVPRSILKLPTARAAAADPARAGGRVVGVAEVEGAGAGRAMSESPSRSILRRVASRRVERKDGALIGGTTGAGSNQAGEAVNEEGRGLLPGPQASPKGGFGTLAYNRTTSVQVTKLHAPIPAHESAFTRCSRDRLCRPLCTWCWDRRRQCRGCLHQVCGPPFRSLCPWCSRTFQRRYRASTSERAAPREDYDAFFLTAAPSAMWAEASTGNARKQRLDQYHLNHAVQPGPFVINPHSTVIKRWDIVMLVLLAYVALVTPFEISFLASATGSDAPLFWVNRAVDLLFALDILLNFFLAVVDEEGQWLLENYRIAANYFSGWFFVDLVSIIPFDIVGLLEEDTSVRKLAVVRVIRLFRLSKLFRIVRASRIFARWQAYLSLSYSWTKLWKFGVVVLTIAHWIACAFRLVVEIELEEGAVVWTGSNWITAFNVDTADSPLEVYITALYWSAMTVTTIGYGDVVPVTMGERILTIVIMLIGASMYAYVVGVVCNILSNLDEATNKFHQTMDNLNRYMDEYGLPPDLRVRLRSYFHYCRQLQRERHYRDLLQDMSPSLRREVAVHINRIWVDRVPFFVSPDAEETEMFLTEIALVMSSEAYAAGDPVIQVGEPTEKLYILTRGVVSRLGRVLFSGSSFGEDMILHDAKRTYAVTALTFVTVSSISRANVETILASGRFPMMALTIRRHSARMSLLREFLHYAKLLRIVRQVEPDFVIESEQHLLLLDATVGLHFHEIRAELVPRPEQPQLGARERTGLASASVLDDSPTILDQGDSLHVPGSPSTHSPSPTSKRTLPRPKSRAAGNASSNNLSPEARAERAERSRFLAAMLGAAQSAPDAIREASLVLPEQVKEEVAFLLAETALALEIRLWGVAGRLQERMRLEVAAEEERLRREEERRERRERRKATRTPGDTNSDGDASSDDGTGDAVLVSNPADAMAHTEPQPKHQAHRGSMASPIGAEWDRSRGAKSVVKAINRAAHDASAATAIQAAMKMSELSQRRAAPLAEFRADSRSSLPTSPAAKAPVSPDAPRAPLRLDTAASRAGSPSNEGSEGRKEEKGPERSATATDPHRLLRRIGSVRQSEGEREASPSLEHGPSSALFGALLDQFQSLQSNTNGFQRHIHRLEDRIREDNEAIESLRRAATAAPLTTPVPTGTARPARTPNAVLPKGVTSPPQQEGSPVRDHDVREDMVKFARAFQSWTLIMFLILVVVAVQLIMIVVLLGRDGGGECPSEVGEPTATAT